jgi:hypothetical protein
MAENGERQTGHGDQKSEFHRGTPIPTLAQLGFSKHRAYRCRWLGARGAAVAVQLIGRLHSCVIDR